MNHFDFLHAAQHPRKEDNAAQHPRKEDSKTPSLLDTLKF